MLIGKKKQKTKGEGAEVLVLHGLYQRSPQQDVGSAAQGALPGQESSPLSLSLFQVLLVEPEEQLESPPSPGCAVEGY